jgi:hypothetical protein
MRKKIITAKDAKFEVSIFRNLLAFVAFVVEK